MDVLLVLMRLVHVLLGVFWVGTMISNAVFLVPAFREAGPDGAKVAAALMRRRFMDVMPAVGILTILSGAWLYWKVSLGFQPAYMRSAVGMTYGWGALAAIVAFAIGMAVVRPSMLRAAALSQTAAAAAPSERDAQLATAQRLRARGAKAGAIVALLLVLAAAAMAVGRYV
ncbi:MAG: hypothetical protein ACT4R6_11435 [Gemmatimonadaceae bacterium]